MTVEQLECPFCGHLMTDHYLFGGRYEQPPEVWCCNEEINPKTLVACGCWGPPKRWTENQLTAIR